MADEMKHGENIQRREKVPIWLKRLDLVRQELRGTRFPGTAEEGLRQCAELSSASMDLLKEEIRRSLRTKDEKTVEREVRRVMARFSRIDKSWKANQRKGRVTAI
ncbi:MAG: hypothetical protein AB1512_04075 [Thermodesulfobacteriota bacterium]